MGLVDAIDEDKMRDAELVESSKGWGCERGAGWIRINDDNGDVCNRECLGAIRGEAN